MKRGVDRGPEALIEGGLVDLLGYDHVEVMQCPQYPSDRPEYQVDSGVLKRPLAVSYNTQHLYQTIQRALKPSKDYMTVPKIITLGGDHSIAMGSIAAMTQKYPDMAVLWVDAHADINTPKTTISGNLHGCPVSFLLQHPDCQGMRGFDWMQQEAKKLDPRAGGSFLIPSRIGYLGLRDVEPLEAKLIRELDITTAYMSDIARCPEGIMGCLKKVLSRIDPKGIRPLFISFDIDGIDPRWAPSTGTPVERGISLSEALEICKYLKSTGRIVGMDLVEVNPEIGNKNDRELTVSTALKVIKTLLGK
jgi:arginase